MEQYSALLSIVYMMAFVFLFDRVHQKRLTARFCETNLLGEQDIARIVQILTACDER